MLETVAPQHHAPRQVRGKDASYGLHQPIGKVGREQRHVPCDRVDPAFQREQRRQAIGAEIVFTPVMESYKDADVKTRRGKTAWWRPFTHLIKILSKYEYHDDEFDAEKVELLKNRDPAKSKHSRGQEAHLKKSV